MAASAEHQLEIVILLLAVVLALTTIAQKILIPYPILLVIGGLVLGMLPGLPMVTLSPDLVFLVFLPPSLGRCVFHIAARVSPESQTDLAVALGSSSRRRGLWRQWRA